VAQKLIQFVLQEKNELPGDLLTEREIEVMALMARGYTKKAIASQLKISDRTVQGHIAHIFHKTNSSSHTEAVMRAVSLGWVSQGILQE
jgi:DNA-binding NarL/FixJ family response regulator